MHPMLHRILLILLLFAGNLLSAESVQAVADLADFRQVIADAKRKVFPSVVFLMPIAERYDGGKREKAQVAGSGVIISPEGYVATNCHVVDKAVDIRCLLYDGSARRAVIVGMDKDTDLALLKLDAAEGEVFPVAELADSASLEEGQFVMAMGAPWGLSRSVSLGILSCVDRFLPGQGRYNLWLQTDASINPGNSGGPLIDTDGRVVGINSLGFIFGGDMAFAIPANTVKFVTGRIRRDGLVLRAWTGMHLQPLKDFERNIFYDGDQGVLVSGVDPDSPADRAGVRVGQLLLAVNGETVRGINHEDIPAIHQLLAELPVGEEARLTLRHAANGGGDAEGDDADAAGERECVVVPMEKGVVEGGDFDCRRWNMTVKAINEFATPILHFFKSRGVYIQAVKHPGNAATAGLRRGDIILEMNGEPIDDMEACRRVYEAVVADEARERKVDFTIMRAGLKKYHILDYAPSYGQD